MNSQPRVTIITTIASAAILGLVAAAFVWYLERFEIDQTIRRLEEMLAEHARRIDQKGEDIVDG